MSDAITVITPRTLDEAKSLSSMLSKATLLPQALRGKEADVLMTIMAGAELGLAPLQSIRLIHIIDGKPSMAADLIAGLCMKQRDVCEYVTCTESTPERATYEAKRAGSPKPVSITFTFNQAKLAGLVGKQNWTKYPDAMLRARAVAAVCRAVFPDLVGGLYDPDELERDVTPPRPTPPNVIDSTATVESSERTVLEAAVATANNEAELTALVERITRLGAADKAKVRAAWGARRDELRNAALAMAAVVPEQTEAVPS
jgi:hypothetical protein